jgi:hypothetical protein
MAGWPDFPPPEKAVNGPWGAPVTGVIAVIPKDPPTLTPKVSPRMRLHTVNDVQRELRRLYIESRNGNIKPADATKLAYILNMLANLMVDSDLEDRVNALLQEKS